MQEAGEGTQGGRTNSNLLTSNGYRGCTTGSKVELSLTPLCPAFVKSPNTTLPQLYAKPRFSTKLHQKR